MRSAPGSVIVLPDAESLADAAAGWVAATVRNLLVEQPMCALALAGGHTPIKTYETLVERHRGSVPWGRVLFLQGDERMVPPDHQASNYAMARRELLDPLGIPDTSVIRVRTEMGSAEATATDYEDRLRATLRRSGPSAPDLALLGLGEDGHTASLMPGSAALEERNRLVTWCSSPEVEHERVTLTLPALNGARHVAFLVSGPQKAEILARVLGGDRVSEPLPAQRIQPESGNLHWFVDADAARELPFQQSDTDGKSEDG
jgi:6-phosphogluconolactonase